MKLSSAIVDIVVELVELSKKNALQIETEKTKLKQMGTNERLDILLGAKTDVSVNKYLLCFNASIHTESKGRVYSIFPNLLFVSKGIIR